MSILAGKYDYYRQRIRLGSMSIKKEDFPFVTFLIGNYLSKVDGNIDILFEFFDLLQELKEQRLLSQLLRIQLLKLLEQLPQHLKSIISTLTNYKNGNKINIIQEIQSYFNKGALPIKDQSAPFRDNNLNNQGTLQLENSYTQQLNQNVSQNRSRQEEERDIQLARKMQEQFDKERVPVVEEQDIPCEICYCGLFQDKVDGPDKCGHMFHTNCMVQAFKTNILSNNFPIICPKQDCKTEVSEADLRRILDKPLFEKYQNHTLKAYADRNGDSISWCPTANCTYMFFYEKNDNERFQCLECKKQYCLNCRVQWHKQMTCKQYKVSTTTSEADKQFIEFVKGKKFKQCPKCKFWVQKNQGCDHMTCKCKFEFCYKCGGVYMKCQCVQQMKIQAERRRLQQEKRRLKKQERKRLAAQRAAARAAKLEQKEKPKQTRTRKKK